MFGQRITRGWWSKLAQHVCDGLRRLSSFIRCHISGVRVESEQTRALGTKLCDFEHELFVVVDTAAVSPRAGRRHDPFSNVTTSEAGEVWMPSRQDQGHEVFAVQTALLRRLSRGGNFARTETVELCNILDNDGKLIRIG